MPALPAPNMPNLTRTLLAPAAASSPSGRGVTRPSASSALVAALVLLCVLAGLLAVARPASADATTDRMEQEFLDKINGERAARGLRTLGRTDGLVPIARAWSQQLVSDGKLSHNPRLVEQVNAGVTDQWRRLGENVGYGPSVPALHTAFMNSEGHRKNVLGDYTTAGVGVLVVSGRIWVTVAFMNAPSSAAAPRAAAPETPPTRTSASPVGSVDSATVTRDRLRLTGWTLDPDDAASSSVHVYLDGRFHSAAPAADERPDVAAAYPGRGARHGFGLDLGVPQGRHTVCAYGIDLSGDPNRALGCRTIEVDGTPVGSFDQLTRSATGTLQLVGWTFDPDVPEAITVHVYVDGRFTARQSAAAPRSDVAAAHPGAGSGHGYVVDLQAPAGPASTCVYAINVGPGSGNRLLGCRQA